jgi:hypothetical protein
MSKSPRKKSSSKKPPESGGPKAAGPGKVGDSAEAARQMGGKSDFGIPEKMAEKEARFHQFEYGPRPIGSHMSSSGETGRREHGVGTDPKHGSHGRGSGGEVDPDIVGFGTPGHGPMTTDGELGRDKGPDIVEPPAEKPRHGEIPQPNVGGNREVQGTTFDRSGGDTSTTNPGGGAASIANAADGQQDNAFAGEVSLDEARGADNSPNDNQ